MKLFADWGRSQPGARIAAARSVAWSGTKPERAEHKSGGAARAGSGGRIRRARVRDAGARLLRFERDLIKVLTGARRCRLCHFSIEDAIDPALSAIWCDRESN
jgi:hypothetical protein